MSKRIFISLLLIIAATSAVAAPSHPPCYVRMTLLTTNDLHANLMPFDIDAKYVNKAPTLSNVGGAARRAYFIRKTRAETVNPVLLFDSGDTTYGTNTQVKKYHGALDVEVMNALGYDAMEPGNHDFQWPSTDTLRNLKSSRFPWICANLVDPKTGKLFLTPYIARNVGGVRVAIFGLITQMVSNNRKAYKAATKLGLVAQDPIKTAAELVPRMRQNADIVILLSHLGAKLDQKLASEVPGVDIILGGHSHTRLAQPQMVATGQESVFDMGSVPVVQAFCYGSEIGRTQVIFHRDAGTGRYTLMSCKGDLVSMDKSIPDDPQIAQMLRK